MGQLTTGNKIVDAVSKINFQGDITPRIWRKTITKANGKPYPLARDILSDLVYWYRATEIVDEDTQDITMKKKFRDDLLYKTYDQLGEEFGESKRVIRDALKRLEELGVICRHFRTVTYENGITVNNVMYIELVPSVLYALTYPDTVQPVDNGEGKDKEECNRKNPNETAENREPLPPSDENVHRVQPEQGKETTPGDENVTRVVTDPSPYTKNTTENTENDTNSPCLSVREGHGREGNLCPSDRTDRAGEFLRKAREISSRGKEKAGVSGSVLEYQEMQKLKWEFLRGFPEDQGEEYPMEFVKAWFDYDDLELYGVSGTQADAVMEILYDALNSRQKTIRIRGEDKPAPVVKGKLLKLDSFDIRYALGKYESQTTRIRNQQAYLLTVLYLAKEQKELDISNQVQYDFYGKKEGD